MGSDGHAVGGKMSLADVTFFAILGDQLDAATHPELPVTRRDPLGNAAKTAAALDAYPKIKAIVHKVASHPNMVKWLAMRGKQAF